MEDWLASKLSSLGADPDTDPSEQTDLDPDQHHADVTVDQDTRRATDDVDLDDDDAATIHDDSFRAQHQAPSPAAGPIPGRIVARAPVSPELPLLTGGRGVPSQAQAFDPATDRFELHEGPETGEWSPDLEETQGPEVEELAWDEVDPREPARAHDEETGILLQRTDPSISHDHQPTEFEHPEFQHLPPPAGFLDLENDPGTQWEVERRAPRPPEPQEHTAIRYSPGIIRRLGEGDDDDDEMPTVIAKPGQYLSYDPVPASAEKTEALGPPSEAITPPASNTRPTPPTRPLPPPPRPAQHQAGPTVELVWIASAIGGLAVLAALVLAALGWLSLH